MIEIKSTFDNDQVRAIQELGYKKAKKLFLVIAAIFVAFGVAVLFSAYQSVMEKTDYVMELVVGICFIAAGVGYFFLCKHLYMKNSAKQIKSMGDSEFGVEKTYKFDEEKIFIFANKDGVYRSAVEATYKYLYMVQETEEFVYLFISQSQCHIISKKAIKPEDQEKFYAILRENMKERYLIVKNRTA